MNRHIAIYLLTVFVLFSACGDGRNGRFAAWLEGTDSLMRTRPDSAYALLEGMKDTAGMLPLSLRMRYHLLHAKAQNKAYVDFTTDSLLLSLTDYYDRHGTPNEQMLAYYLLGCTYRDMGEAPKAMESYQTALDRVDTTVEDCDYYDLSRVYAQMATTFHQQNLPEDELRARRMYEKYAWKAKDMLDALLAYANRAHAYYRGNKMDSVLYVGYQGYRRFLEYGYSRSGAQHASWLYSYYTERKQYDSAYKYLDIYEKESGYVDTCGNVAKGHETYYYHKGLLYLGVGKTDGAESLFRRLLAFGPNEAEAAYRGLLQIYKRKGDADSIAKYAQLFCDANDSVHRKRNSQMTHQVSAMYNYGRNQRLAMEKEKEAEASQRWNIMLVVLIALAIMAFSVIMYLKKQRFNRLVEENKNIYTMYQRLQAEINVIQNSPHEWESLLDAKKTQVHELEEKIKMFHPREKTRLFKSSPIAQKIGAFVVHHVGTPSEDDWETLEGEFKSFFPTFNQTDMPKLTPVEVRMLALMALGLNGKEIGNLMDVSKSRISHLKKQVNGKVFGKDDATSLRKMLSDYMEG